METREANTDMRGSRLSPRPISRIGGLALREMVDIDNKRKNMINISCESPSNSDLNAVLRFC